MSTQPRSSCPLCGAQSRYGRDLMGTETYYVVDCPSCRQLRIPAGFLTKLWDAQEPERRAVGRLILDSRTRFGPSLDLDAERYLELVTVLRARRWTPARSLR